MEFNKTTGLRSVWNSYLIYDDPEGSRLRAKVQELQSIFLGTYTDWLGNMEFKPVETNFYRGLQANKQQFCSMTWRNLGSPVLVMAAVANEPFLADQPIGCITILYRADLAENSATLTETPGSGQAQAPVAQADEKQSGGIPRSWRAAAITIILLASLMAIRAISSSGTQPPALSTADQELMATARRGAECLHLSDRKEGNVALSEVLRAGRDCPDAAGAGAGTR
jgi:hypothetical protein